MLHAYYFLIIHASMADDKFEVIGKVLEVKPGGRFIITLVDEAYKDMKIEGHLSGKMRMHYIKLFSGDYVKIDISVYDLTKGIITYRLRPHEYEKILSESNKARSDEAEDKNTSLESDS
jgi:translation initiation factor IF-1